MSRRAVVVGGAGAIGRVVSDVLAEQGMTVVVADLRGTEEVAQSLPGDGHRGIPLDVTDVDAVLRTLGPDGAAADYDAVVYAAGTNYTGPVATTDWSAYDRVLDVNLRCAFHVGQALSLNLAASTRELSAVFLSSTAGLRGESGAAVYAASKFGLIGFVECLASEIAAFGARANSVCPGNVDSPMLRTLAAQVAERRSSTTEAVLDEFAGATAFGRLIDIREVAQVVAFLEGETSTGMSGQSIVVDGPPL